MTNTQDIRYCNHCGAPFKRSRGDSTVNCPAHRTAQSRRAPRGVRQYPAIPCSQCGHVHTTLRCDRCGF